MRLTIKHMLFNRPHRQPQHDGHQRRGDEHGAEGESHESTETHASDSQLSLCRQPAPYWEYDFPGRCTEPFRQLGRRLRRKKLNICNPFIHRKRRSAQDFVGLSSITPKQSRCGSVANVAYSALETGAMNWSIV